MARARSGFTPDNAAQAFLYLMNAIDNPDRWRSLIKDAAKTKSADAAAALRGIPILSFCPLTAKPSPSEQLQAQDPLQLACALNAPELQEFNAWAAGWVSNAGWARILTAIRQSRHAERNELKSIKIDPRVHARLSKLATNNIFGANLNDVIDKLTAFAEEHPETFNR